MQIIKPSLNYMGKFAVENPKYQFINWTDEYILTMIAAVDDGTKYGRNLRHEMVGSYDALKQVYDANRSDCIYAVLSQIRVLGDGSKDSNVRHYKMDGHMVPEGFQFKGVA